LAMKYRDPLQLEILMNQMIQKYQSYCLLPLCLQYRGVNRISSQVGEHSGLSIETDGRAGYLIDGPYQFMKAGEYTLQVMGDVASNGNNVVVDVVWADAEKSYARFQGIGKTKLLDDNVLLNETVILDEDVGRLEVRVYVDENVELSIDGYELRLITKK